MNAAPMVLALPREAKVVTRPVARSILRIARLPVSPTSAKVPSALKATPVGWLNRAALPVPF